MARLSLPNNEHLDYILTAPAQPTDTLFIYIHGFASHQHGEKALYFRDRVVERGFASLAVDLRGHGDSSGTIETMTLTRGLEDLAALLAGPAAPYERIVFIGSSMGGQLAAWTAARHPGRIAANFLIAPAFSFYENRLRDLGEADRRRLDQGGDLRVKNEWIDVTVGRRLIDDAKQYQIGRLLPTYRTPTLIVHGTADTTVFPEGSLDFVRRATVPPVDLLLIAGGDHRLTRQKEYLFELMLAFLHRIGFLS
ncbi:MAG: alpha/beta fold hydrolase [Nitrospirae bacterium]|nr:alpha/beta fold hydrolase [Candidatus Manganitrophaceae bacterium]